LPDGVVRAKLSELDTRRRGLLDRKTTLEGEKADPKATGLSPATRIGQIDTVIAAIETFSAALRTIPTGGVRSPLATAMLREQLHPSDTADRAADDSKFTHVLCVQAAAGSTQQVVSDRPLWFEDKFSAIGVISVAYILIEVVGSQVLAAGSAGGQATVKGKIGSSFSVETEPLDSSTSTS
jgi:hypothetical protein